MGETSTTSAASQRERHAACMRAIADARSREAFIELFEFFAPRLKSYMMRLGANDGEAEDLAQDVMVTVWRKADLYDARQASVSTWIFRIARNRRIDVQRKTNRPKLDPDDPMLQPPEAERPDSAVDRMQMEEIVREAVSKLPPEQYTLLQASFYDGLSHSEIAEAYDLPLGTVKSRIRLAFNRLRASLEGDHGDA